VEIPAQTARAMQSVDIRLDDGTVVGSIVIPEGVTGRDSNADDYLFTIKATLVEDPQTQAREGRRIMSAVADITLDSPTLGSLNQLAKPLKICLQADEENDYCLSYRSDPSDEWKCEDQCLEKKDNAYCGQTDHLTSFALLLGQGVKDCSDSADRLFIWLSVGFIGGALILVLVAVISMEIYLRVASKRRSEFLRQIASE